MKQRTKTKNLQNKKKTQKKNTPKNPKDKQTVFFV